MSNRSKGAIIGAAETLNLGVIKDQSSLELHAEAARLAVADAGLTLNDIDGIATVGLPPITVAHHLGLKPQFIEGTYIGGGSFLLHVRRALAAIDAGVCKRVLITHGQSGRSRLGHPPRVTDPASPMGQFEQPYGTKGPPTLFPMGVLRYMQKYGLTHEQLAAVPVAQRAWASRVPRAMFRDEITTDDVLASRMVAYPMHLLECCLVTDGGAAVVVASAEEAICGGAPNQAVHIIGAGEAAETSMVSTMADLSSSQAFCISSAQAFAEAGLGPDSVDHLMVYDAFAHLPIYALEDCGFVGRGEAGEFISAGETSPGGRLPMNTNGGGLSYTHTGLYGMFLLQESIRQIRGQAAAQVPDVNISFVQGVGGMFEAAGSLVLASPAACTS